MPIFPVRQLSNRVLAVFLLPSWLQMQSSSTESTASLRERLRELEKVLED